tara:strand:+ start:150 stop:515 length:366 start_codon:yes stop_codon:yes gene_type:complete
MKLLARRNSVTVDYNFFKYTYEKIRTNGECYKIETLRKEKCVIKVIFDIENKTVQVEDKTYNTTILREWAYKKLKGNNIGVNCFDSFIKHIQESSDRGNVFHHATQGLLLSLSKNKFTYIS